MTCQLGVNRPHQGLHDGVVDHRLIRQFTVDIQFSRMRSEHHDGIVDGETDHGQESSQEECVNFPMKEVRQYGFHAEDDCNIMQHGDDRRHTIAEGMGDAPECQGDINKDAECCQSHRILQPVWRLPDPPKVPPIQSGSL